MENKNNFISVSDLVSNENIVINDESLLKGIDYVYDLNEVTSEEIEEYKNTYNILAIKFANYINYLDDKFLETCLFYGNTKTGKAYIVASMYDRIEKTHEERGNPEEIVKNYKDGNISIEKIKDIFNSKRITRAVILEKGKSRKSIMYPKVIIEEKKIELKGVEILPIKEDNIYNRNRMYYFKERQSYYQIYKSMYGYFIQIHLREDLKIELHYEKEDIKILPKYDILYYKSQKDIKKYNELFENWGILSTYHVGSIRHSLEVRHIPYIIEDAGENGFLILIKIGDSYVYELTSRGLEGDFAIGLVAKNKIEKERLDFIVDMELRG